MLYTIAVILIIIWLVSFLALHITGGLIHLLVVLAVIIVVVQLVTGRRGV